MKLPQKYAGLRHGSKHFFNLPMFVLMFYFYDILKT